MGKTSGLAIASLVLGIFSLVVGWIPIFGWIFISLTLVFGFVALSKIKKDEKVEGKGLAIAGIILAAIPLVVTILFTLLVGGNIFSSKLTQTRANIDKCETAGGECKSLCKADEKIINKNCDKNGNGNLNEGNNIDGVCCLSLN